ncbi:MAG: tetratricopeptide repeat protein [Selenomonadaceae bacterium]|nr:tetratricopeptide repeat protein [Selenomonadaceae bacterium]
MASLLESFLELYRQAESDGDFDRQATVLMQVELELERGHLPKEPAVDFLRQKYKILFLSALVALERKHPQLAQAYLFSFEHVSGKIYGTIYSFTIFYQGLASYRMGLYAIAEQSLREYLGFYPANELAWFLLGNACCHQGKWAEALSAYEKSLLRRRDFREALHNSAFIARKTGVKETAEVLSRLAWTGTGIAEPVDMIEEPDEYAIALPEAMEIWGIPIFINCRDRVECLRKLVAWLCDAGYRKIYLLDNASTYPKLLSYYDGFNGNENVRVVFLQKNMGHTALWDSGILEELQVRTPYIYSDPDVLPVEQCPKDFVGVLWDVLKRYPFLRKVGPGLVMEDITYYDAREKRELELRWYQHLLEENVYFGTVDTTFALYRNCRYYTLDIAARVTGSMRFRHLPWYYDFRALPEDEAYYMEHASTSSSIHRKYREDKTR